jgi:hypothetical protein
LSTIYDGKSMQLDGPEDAGFRPGTGQVSDEQPVIHAPCLSLLALLGTDHLSTLMRASETGRGSLQQLLLAIGDERTILEQEPQDLSPPPWVAERLRQIRRVPVAGQGADLTLADLFSNVSADMRPQQTVVSFAVSLTPVYAALDTLSSDRRVRSLLLAARGQVRRVAAGLAVWANPASPVVTAEVLDWAGAYVRDRVREVIEQFALFHGDEGKPAVYDQVMKLLIDAGSNGIAKRDLHTTCWAYRNLPSKARGELLEQMLGDESIFEVSHLNPQTSRKNKVLVAAKFVAKREE